MEEAKNRLGYFNTNAGGNEEPFEDYKKSINAIPSGQYICEKRLTDIRSTIREEKDKLRQ